MQIGLTLGKYAPFHKGHQYVIETALREMDKVIVIIYDAPETTTVPLNIRADQIRKLYPQVTVTEAWDGPSEVGDSPEIRKKHEDYIIHNLNIKHVDAFYSSEFYGLHVSQALRAENRIVDKERIAYNISSTLIRQNPYKYRKYLDPLVYSDLIINAVFLGAPSTGKTTITELMARKFNTQQMPEYGREYWEKHHVNRRLTLEQLVEIAERHLKIENRKIAVANRYLFTDTNALTTFIFSQYYHNVADPRLEKSAAQAEKRYDLIFVCDTDIPYSDTWDRSGDMNRTIFQKRIIADLQKRRLPFFLLQGNLQKRIEKVSRIISGYRKYQNITELSD
ncbi:AAA family ATPase [Desulfococcaceae bacterium HSG7]|nr:AAA family ATPase [Desulfococcaceae bacterium HSG7]